MCRYHERGLENKDLKILIFLLHHMIGTLDGSPPQRWPPRGMCLHDWCLHMSGELSYTFMPLSSWLFILGMSCLSLCSLVPYWHVLFLITFIMPFLIPCLCIHGLDCYSLFPWVYKFDFVNMSLCCLVPLLSCSCWSLLIYPCIILLFFISMDVWAWFCHHELVLSCIIIILLMLILAYISMY